MNLVDVYNLLETGEISEEEAAHTLGLTVRGFRVRKGKWGHKLPLVFSILDKIKADKITRDEAAQALGIGVRATNKLAESWGVIRPIKEYVVRRNASKVKWESHKKHAIDFISGTMPLEEASERSNLSTRMMRRWVATLLEEHMQMTWKDLTSLPVSKRGRIANQIEEAEDLALAKQNVINAIARGDRTLEEEALARVMARRARIHKAARPKGTEIVRRSEEN